MVLYDTIDGGGDSGNPSAISALISDTGTGLTVDYNWLKNAPNTVVAVKGGTLDYEFNLVEDVGFGASSAETDLMFSGGVSNNFGDFVQHVLQPPHATTHQPRIRPAVEGAERCDTDQHRSREQYHHLARSNAHQYLSDRNS